MDFGDAPGFGVFVVESAGSKRRQSFVFGKGQRVPNEGQLVLNLEGDLGLNGGKRKMTSTFQVAEVTRPLMSVSRVCDKGMRTCIDHRQKDRPGSLQVKEKSSTFVKKSFVK